MGKGGFNGSRLSPGKRSLQMRPSSRSSGRSFLLLAPSLCVEGAGHDSLAANSKRRQGGSVTHHRMKHGFVAAAGILLAALAGALPAPAAAAEHIKVGTLKLAQYSASFIAQEKG